MEIRTYRTCLARPAGSGGRTTLYGGVETEDHSLPDNNMQHAK